MKKIKFLIILTPSTKSILIILSIFVKRFLLSRLLRKFMKAINLWKKWNKKLTKREKAKLELKLFYYVWRMSMKRMEEPLLFPKNPLPKLNFPRKYWLLAFVKISYSLPNILKTVNSGTLNLFTTMIKRKRSFRNGTSGRRQRNTILMKIVLWSQDWWKDQ